MSDCIGAAGTVAFKAWKRWMIPMPRSGLGGRGGAPRLSSTVVPGSGKPAEISAPALFLLCGNERLETPLFAGNRPSGRGQMEEFIARLNQAGVRYAMIGGQTIRLLVEKSTSWKAGK